MKLRRKEEKKWSVPQTYMQRKIDPDNRQRHGRPALPSLCFLTLGARFCSLPLHQSYSQRRTTKLNSRGCRTLSLPFLKVFFFFLYRLTPLSLSGLTHLPAYQPSPPCMLSYFFFFFFFTIFASFVWLKNRSGANYINNCKVWKTPAKNAQTTSIFPCTVHWLMSGAGHYMSRHRKSAFCCLSCQYSATHTKYHSRRPLSFAQICRYNSFGRYELVTSVKWDLLCCSY